MSTSIIQSRFKGAEYMSLLPLLPICMVGAGGIGSPFAFIISRANPKSIYLYEYDTVEEHNLGGQIYNKRDIGHPKAAQTIKRVSDYSDYQNIQPLGKLEEQSEVTPITFMCVDDNPARYTAFQAWKKEAEANNWVYKVEVNGINYDVPYVMYDGRLSFNSYDVFVITKDNYKYHEENNLPKENKNLLEEGCTTKANPEVGFLTAARMFTYYRNWLQNVIDVNQGYGAFKNVPYRFNENLSTGHINVWKNAGTE